ncbi:ATP-binding cassette, subfamily B, multidrug efflux pump [Bartonella apihabitans]|uniref:ATP-binding cassette, subfamily B, multidrug efflux pump n=1 Tax=Bartonella apihabitans TaxID=2750929 RepID=A0A1U9MCU2_9HYPH|nr:ABC transporter ATP-binding protein [Bartonella apihabitans]AQT43096.1 ATP-binding cassette, subfamily B, multidrug efflux pump [Bartonella apihabitans]
MFGWFERRLNAFPEKELKRPPQNLLGFCLYYTEGVWPWLIFMAIFTALIAVTEVSLFGFLGSIVDWLNANSRATFFETQGVKLALIGVLVVLILPFFVTMHSMVMHQTLLGNYPMRIRWLVHRYLLGQSMSFFQNEFSGRISAKVMQTALSVRETVMKLFDVLNYVIVYFLGTLVIAASSDWRLMVPFLLWIISYIGLLKYFIPKLRDASEAQADARSLMTGRVVDSYTNIATVKLFSHHAREESFAREGFEHFQGTVYKQMRLISKFSISVYVSNCILLFVVGALGIWLWQRDAILVGAVAVSIGLVLRLNGMAQWIMWEMAALFENIGIVEDGMHSIAQDRIVEDKKDAKKLVVKKGDIRFENVGFHYGKGKGILKDFNLHIEPGQKVGVVGRSGAGKSTLVNLLLRFHDVEEGAILIDGQNIADVTQESLRAAIGVVTQDTSLLHRSLKDNILYGRPDASNRELLEAVKDAEAADFIDSLRDQNGKTGYDAFVGERGARLSGGQRQRIAISRVMLKDAPILILDEATSALDSEVEAAIQENLARLMEGKTVLAIAHRLSTIAEMDRLIVMDKGKIVEDGTHEELLSKHGIYAHLWNRQVGGHLDLDEEA